jgi:hypothetical protein
MLGVPKPLTGHWQEQPTPVMESVMSEWIIKLQIKRKHHEIYI